MIRLGFSGTVLYYENEEPLGIRLKTSYFVRCISRALPVPGAPNPARKKGRLPAVAAPGKPGQLGLGFKVLGLGFRVWFLGGVGGMRLRFSALK